MPSTSCVRPGKVLVRNSQPLQDFKTFFFALIITTVALLPVSLRKKITPKIKTEWHYLTFLRPKEYFT